MKTFFYTIIIATSLVACSGSDIKENIHKAGDVAGQTAGEFIEGAKTGVEKAFDVKVELNANLKNKGIEFGKTTVSSDTLGEDNLLIVYTIFHSDYNDTIMAKVFDENTQEMGRATAIVSAKKDEAKFIEFHFDKRTNIDSEHKITIE